MTNYSPQRKCSKCNKIIWTDAERYFMHEHKYICRKCGRIEFGVKDDDE